MSKDNDSDIYESTDDDISENESISMEENEPDESEVLRNQLADIPLGELQKLKDNIGLKKYNDVIFGPNRTSEDINSNMETFADRKKGKRIVNKTKAEKKKKSEPGEMSSKRKPPSAPRNVIGDDSKRRKRDPRFDNLSGVFNEDLFQKSYAFVEDIKKDEMKSVKKQLKKVKNKERKSSLHKLYQRMLQQEKVAATKGEQKRKERERKKEAFTAIKSGKKAFYPKKSDLKKFELAEKYRKLKDNGQLERYMGKKRKKSTQKEKKQFLN